jgi:replicative DNA helicase
MLGSQGFTETATNAAVAPDHPQLVPHNIEAIVTPAIPHSFDAEEGLLGALAIDSDQMINVGYLKPGDFYLTRNEIIYRAMVDLWERHQGYDYITLIGHLEETGKLDDIGGTGIIADMMNFTPTSLGASKYAAIIYDRSGRRQVINEATKAAQLAYRLDTDYTISDIVNEIVSGFSQIDTTRNVSNGPKSISSGVSALLDRMEQIEASGEVAGLQTGIKALDHILGGFQEKQFYLLAGQPGMGKSALAIQITYNVAKRGIPVLYFSLEMSNEKISGRLVSSICGVEYDLFKRPGKTEQQILDILAASDEVAQLPLTIDETPGLTVSAMRSIAQRLMISEPIGLVIVDHLGLLSSPGKDEYHEVTKISHGLMALSKQLNLPVLALSQLSRGLKSRQDKRPVMSDLRGSGHLEQDADNILFLYRDEVYNPDTEFPHLAEINIAKNRDGKTGIAQVYAQMATNRFVDLETRTVSI